MANETPVLRLAVLIDGDNVSPDAADEVFGQVKKLGDARVRRIYGDFSGTIAKGWKAAAAEHAILQRQQFVQTAGKNTTDISLVIDAMDLLHTSDLDGFCIVSSDGDFTQLAIRISERGLKVYGFGQPKASLSFQRACDAFYATAAPITVERDKPPALHLVPVPVAKPAAIAKPAASAKPAGIAKPAATPSKVKSLADAERILSAAIAANEVEWVTLSAIGVQVRKTLPEFTSKMFSAKNLITLIQRIHSLELSPAKGAERTVRLRPKASKSAA